MPVEPGQMLSHYRLAEKIGEGGMGEVYRAEDTRLGREIALKVLPSAMAADTERRARFEREAKAIAALNHPNIVTLHSVEEAEGLHFLTMELVEGKTLSELIPGQGLSLDRFFELAVALADAVSAAHERGITHRDLKPANVMVGKEGRLKVLDFGLAKLREEAQAEDGTTQLPTKSITHEGKILGTLAYMSPEQVEGKPVDHRSDIFSLGVILYEMATGQRPFKGDTGASIVSSILRDAPAPVSELNRSLPRHLGRIVRHCLQKDPERRSQTAKDLRNELEELKEEVSTGEWRPETAAPGASQSKAGRRWVFVAVPAVVVLVVGYLWLENRSEDSVDRSSLLTPTFSRITSQPGEELFPSLSPDGRMLVYSSKSSGNWDVFLQRVGGAIPNNLTEDFTGDDNAPALSPDGEYIAFRSERQGGGIFVMGATGESVRRLSDFGFNPAWSPDGAEIFFTTEDIVGPGDRGSVSELWAVDVSDGRKRRIAEGDAVQSSASPHGHRIAYWGLAEGESVRNIWTIPTEGGEAVPVTSEAAIDWNPVWSPDGTHLYFSSDRGGSMNLWRVPIDERSGQVQGEPEPVTTGASASRQHPSISADGRRVAYVELVTTSNIHRIAFDSETGTVEGQPIPVTRGSVLTRSPWPSPDGEWIVYKTMGKQEDLFVARNDGTDLRQLTNDVHKDREPRWSPDGKHIAFFSNRSGSVEIWTINPDGTDLRQITNTPGAPVNPVWSSDSSRIAYSAVADRSDSYIVDLALPWDEQQLQPLPPVNEAGDTFQPSSWSPDGRVLAGHAPTGIYQYSVGSGEYRELIDFGSGAIWLADGRRLVFVSQGRLFLIDSESGDHAELLSLDPVASIQPWFSLSPDNRTIYFGRTTRESDIWMLELN
jgi:Tol biopolymer transport system component